MVRHRRDAPSHSCRAVKHGSRDVTQELQTDALNDILHELLVGVAGVLESSILPFKPQIVYGGGK